MLVNSPQSYATSLRPKTKFSYVSPDDPLPLAIAMHTLEQLGGKRRVENIYTTMMTKYEEINVSFWEDALEQFELKVDYDPAQLDKVPQEGPVIFVGNHPYGLADGVIMGYLAQKARGPFKVMINSLLCSDDELIQDYVLPVNFAPTKAALRETVVSKRHALKALKAGGSMVVFPAGNVSTSPKGLGMAFDFEWRLFTAKLIQVSQATVIPVYFSGQNSRLFQVTSHFHYLFRACLFIRELNRLRGKTIKVEVGDPIPYTELAHFQSKQEMTNHLHSTVYRLGNLENVPIARPYWEAQMT